MLLLVLLLIPNLALLLILLLGLLPVQLLETPEKVDHAVGVAPAVVVPGEGLGEAIADHHGGQGVEGRGERGEADVGRDDRVRGVLEDP